MKKISIIIRTKNEERWISQCLKGIEGQKATDYEVILVDNNSTDKTIEKARQFKPSKIINCEHFLPGKALNMGIEQSSGDYIVAISGHCIPVNDKWLESLLANFADNSVAGVYGRQEAMSFTSDYDKRDLALIFGLDRKVQTKDSFFHNANSMIRRDVWNQIRFDDNVTNIEDRVWAQKVLQRGYKIVYEPEASVYHYHGIHQNQNSERCANVVRILKDIHSDYDYKTIDVDRQNVVALIPVKGPVKRLGGRPLIEYTIERVRESRLIKRIIVSTDNEETARVAKKAGAEVPFMRDESLSREHVDIGKVLEYSLEKIEDLKIYPDLIVSLEITFPFRPKGLLDDMIGQLARHGFDSVVAARRENRAIWKEEDGRIIQLDEGMLPRQFKEPTFIGLKGVGCVTHPEFLRSGNFLGKNIGIYEVNNPYSHIEVRSDEEIRMASVLIDEWLKQGKDHAKSEEDNIYR